MTTENALIKCGIKYEDKGNRFIANCPFHSEKTPSFSIYKEGGFWKCFGCGRQGGLRDLLFELTGEKIVTPTFVIDSTLSNTNENLRLTNYTIKGEFLPISDNNRVKEYCWEIGFTNSFIDFFNVQYFRKVAFIHDASNEERYYYNRIVIPCLLNGEVYNYECRDFTRRSSTKVLYPSKAENDFLFNFDNIDLEKPVIVVEGIKGLANVWANYSKNVVSTFGKVLKRNQKKQLLQCKHIIRLPDNDKGENNIVFTIEEMDSFYDREYYIAEIKQEGADPANLTIGQLQSCLSKAQPSTQFLFDRFLDSSLQTDSYSIL